MYFKITTQPYQVIISEMGVTHKAITIGLIAIAFVAGSAATEFFAFAAKGDPKGTPFKAIWVSIANLQEQIDELGDLRTEFSCENNLILREEIPEFTPNLAGCDLTGVNLSSEVFNEVDFSGTTLTDTDLSKSDFIGADFGGAHFERTNVDNADFEDAIQPSGEIDCIGKPRNADFTCLG